MDDTEDIMLSQTERQIIYDLTCTWNLKKKKKKKKNIGREQWLPGVECRLNGEILVNGL